MGIKAVLFDLDGTLLPMDQDIFVKAYFKGLTSKMAPFGFDAEKLIKVIWGGTEAMVKNNGEKTNEEAFWDFFAGVYGEEVRKYEPTFEEFYRIEFSKVKDVCGTSPEPAEIIKSLKQKGLKLALATNPIFPKIATESRIGWAGLESQDFEIITTYENCVYSKPNPKYFLSIAEQLGVKPEECLMVGNDVGDDMPAKDIGMQVFLLTENLINKTESSIDCYPNGDYAKLKSFLETI